MSKTGAIVTDAPGSDAPGDEEETTAAATAAEQGEEGAPEDKRAPTPREAAMQEIVARRQREVAAEAAGETVDPSEPAEERDLEDEAEQAATEAAAPAPAPAQRKIKLKIEGHEVEATEAEVVARAQKNWAADLRLQEAAQRKAELDRREEELRRREAALANPPAPTQNQTSPPSGATPDAGDAELDTELDAVVSNLFAGDEEKAKQSLKKIIARRPTATAPTVSKSEIVAEAVATLRRDNERRQLQEAVDVFHTEYQDLAADETLAAAWDAETAKLQKATPNRSYVEIAREAGNNLRAKLKARSQDQGGTRLERKRQVGPALPASGVRATTGKDEPKPKSRAEVIAGMRAARGQPTY